MAGTDPVIKEDRAPIDFGCEHFGRLRSVMLHRPGRELALVTPDTAARYLFDEVPDIPRFQEEHDSYRGLLVSLGVEVFELTDLLSDGRSRTDRLPNVTYLHDIAVVTCRGAILSRMAWPGRQGEEEVVREALAALGIPTLVEFDDDGDAFEGCLLLAPDAVLVARTERHSAQAVDSFAKRALAWFPEVLEVRVPAARRYMHPDTVFNRVTDRLALAYPPAFERCLLHTRAGTSTVRFRAYMERRGVELVEVSDSEQRRLACTFVPLEPGVVLHYDDALDPATRHLLERRGVEFVMFHPGALTAGGGSLRCLTLRLSRD